MRKGGMDGWREAGKYARAQGREREKKWTSIKARRYIYKCEHNQGMWFRGTCKWDAVNLKASQSVHLSVNELIGPSQQGIQ